MSSRTLYAVDENFILSYEMVNGFLFVHVVLKKFSALVLARLREKWESLVIDAYFDGHEEIFTYTRDPRIVNLIGGAEEVGQNELSEFGTRMFKWDLR